jgi:hypothetical protein
MFVRCPYYELGGGGSLIYSRASEGGREEIGLSPTKADIHVVSNTVLFYFPAKN